MERKNIYVDATDINEFEKVSLENNLPIVVVANKDDLENLDDEARKLLDIYYSKSNESNNYYLNSMFLDTFEDLEEWNKIVFPDGEEYQIKDYETYEYNEKNALKYTTEEGEEFGCPDLIASIKDKVLSLVRSEGRTNQ